VKNKGYVELKGGAKPRPFIIATSPFQTTGRGKGKTKKKKQKKKGQRQTTGEGLAKTEAFQTPLGEHKGNFLGPGLQKNPTDNLLKGDAKAREVTGEDNHQQRSRLKQHLYYERIVDPGGSQNTLNPTMEDSLKKKKGKGDEAGGIDAGRYNVLLNEPRGGARHIKMGYGKTVVRKMVEKTLGEGKTEEAIPRSQLAEETAGLPYRIHVVLDVQEKTHQK